MRVFALIVLLLFCGTGSAAAQVNGGLLTINLADDKVDITTGFNGVRLVLFGVKKKQGDIAIVIQGPPRRMVVRRKDQIAGVWVNRDSLRFRNVPVYYDYALSRQAVDIAPAVLLQRYRIGLNALNFDPVTGGADKDFVKRFTEALIRNKQSQGHFPLDPRNIIFLDNDFFRVNFFMPADVPTGDYIVKTYLFDQGKVLDINETKLRVAQVGFSAKLFRFAHRHGVAYGIVAVFLALLAGFSGWYFLRKE